MKKYFIIGMAIILAISIGTIYYGAWLNQRGEIQITRRMEENRLEVSGAKAQTRDIYASVQLSSVNLYTGAMVDAVALIDGRIMDSRAPKNGFVHKGDVVFVIVNDNLPMQIQEADAGILSATASLKEAENNYSRYKRLRERDATSAAQFDQAEAAYIAAAAQLETAKSRRAQLVVQEARQSVTAPIDGRIIVIYQQPGTYVQAGTSLAMVGDFSSLYFALPLEDEEAHSLSVGQEVELTFKKRAFQKAYETEYEAGNLGSKHTFRARIEEITPPPSEPAAMRNILWQVDNTSGLLEPQTYGDVSFRARESHSCLAVPFSAITDNARDEVFVVAEDGTTQRRAVRTGVDDGEWIEIISGLSAGEIVVTGGMDGLEDGTPVSVTLDEADDKPRGGE